MKKISLLVILLFGLVLVLREQAVLFLFGKGIEMQMAASLQDPDLEDGLHVGFCGAGSPLPDPERSAPCTIIIAGEDMFLFDVGSSHNIRAMGFSAGMLDSVFLTHFHSDHIGDLGEVMLQRWVAGNHTSPLPVYGPAGVTRVVDGFNIAYGLDSDYRTAHHGNAIVPSSGKGGNALRIDVSGDELVTVTEKEHLRISAFLVDHAPVLPAIGYRIEYKGRSIVISGDTVRSDNLIRHASGVDLLVHEGLSMELVKLAEEKAKAVGQKTMEKIFLDIRNYHTSPEDVAKLADEAGVRYLAFNHIVPMLPLPGMKEIFLGGARQYFDGPIHVSSDGDFLSLPADSDDIRKDNRL